MDYLLLIHQEAAGAIEARSQGTTLRCLAEQQKKQVSSDPNAENPLSFVYESSGIETIFLDLMIRV